MNPLILVTLLVAAVSGAPTNLVVTPVTYQQVVAQPQVTYDFPLTVSAPAAHVQVAAPAPVVAAPVHIPAPVVETRVHYAETPVVVGHSAQILKPTLGAAAVAVAAPTPLAYAAPAPLAYAAPAPVAVAAPAVLDLKAPVPAGDAPSMDVLVTKEKVLAPVRATQNITPQITVQHPTKVNVEKVAVEVPVAQPYAHPVPVPVAPQYEIHQIHTPVQQIVAAPALVKAY